MTSLANKARGFSKSNMAGQLPDAKSNVLCRYFMHNACQKGSNCAFSHDRNTPPDLVCRFYLKGQCVYGDQCRYDHDRSRNKAEKPVPSGKITAGDIKEKSGTPSTPEKTGNALQSTVKTLSFTRFRDTEPVKSNMVTLSKGGEPKKVTLPLSLTKDAEEWVKAKEFVPGQFYFGSAPPTYAEALAPAENREHYDDCLTEPSKGDGITEMAETCGPVIDTQDDANLLCPFIMAKGQCRFGEECTYLHGEICDMCGLDVLHPTNQDLRDKHIKDCMEAHERDMELSFAVAASKEKTCGICMDVVLEKDPPNARRFGILENCNHCFCLNCIRQWRCAKQFEKTIIRACPECRVKSDFVTPSQLWVDSPEEKTKLIEGYKNALREKPCRHFDQGRGECPFNDKCFYKHALPDGTIAAPTPRKPRRCNNADGDFLVIHGISLWDFLETDHRRREALSLLEDELPIEIMNYLALSSDLLDAEFSLFDTDSDNDSDF